MTQEPLVREAEVAAFRDAVLTKLTYAVWAKTRITLSTMTGSKPLRWRRVITWSSTGWTIRVRSYRSAFTRPWNSSSAACSTTA